jgi:hypothetical protein
MQAGKRIFAGLCGRGAPSVAVARAVVLDREHGAAKFDVL